MLSSDLQQLQRIRDDCSGIMQTVDRFGKSYDSFQSDTAYQRAIAFDFLQIGEHIGKLSREYRYATKYMMWGFRRLATQIVTYGDMYLEDIWEIVELDIPPLKKFCEEQLAQAGADMANFVAAAGKVQIDSDAIDKLRHESMI